jgi:hypothetical protein
VKKLLVLAAIALLVGCNGVDVSKFQIIPFNGHTYVAYDGGNFDSGLVHDPDCKCHSK